MSRVSLNWVKTMILGLSSSLRSVLIELNLVCPPSIPSSFLSISIIFLSLGCSSPSTSACSASLMASLKLGSSIRFFAALVVFLFNLWTYLLKVDTPWVSRSSKECWRLMTAVKIEIAWKHSFLGFTDLAIFPWTFDLAFRISLLLTAMVFITPRDFNPLRRIFKALFTRSLIFCNCLPISTRTQSISTGLK